MIKCKGRGQTPSTTEGKSKQLLRECLKCSGLGKIRKTQFTTIPPWLVTQLREFLKDKIGRLFPTSRQVVWDYYKQAGYKANLDIFEQQEEKSVEGVWTHLLRKSYGKWMIRQGVPEVLVKLKLRHAFSVTDRYTKPDINYLLQWENDTKHPLTESQNRRESS